MFFKGNFDQANRDTINFDYTCPSCKKTCFKINLRDRLRDDFDKLIVNKILLSEDIEKFNIAKQSTLIKNHYNMPFGGTPTYSFVRCVNCRNEFLIVIGK